MDIVRPTDATGHRPRHAGRRRGYAARDRRGQARLCDVRPDDENEERAEILRRLHRGRSARIDDLTAAMVEEYGGVVRFAGLIVESGVNAFPAAEQALQEMPLTRELGQDDCHLGACRRGRSDHRVERERAVHLPQARFGRRRGLYGRHQAQRVELAADRVLVEALHEAELPKGVCNVVTGRGNIVGAELVRNPDVAKISFTGSVAVGESIMRDGAATMKRVTLELGGKSPTILLDDADLDTGDSGGARAWPS